MRRCYQILTPFKFNGSVLKPAALGTAFVELSDEEAQQYIAAGVVDPDWVEAPDGDDEHGGDASQTNAPESGDTQPGGGETPAADAAVAMVKPKASAKPKPKGKK